jgi:hypothetical protein
VQVDANAAANDYRRAKLATSGAKADRTPVPSPAEDSCSATGDDLSFPQRLNGDHGNDQAAGTDQGGPSPATRPARAEVAGASPVLIQMWQALAQFRCRCVTVQLGRAQSRCERARDEPSSAAAVLPDDSALDRLVRLYRAPPIGRRAPRLRLGRMERRRARRAGRPSWYLPHLRRDWSKSAPGLAHVCAETDSPTSAPGLPTSAPGNAAGSWRRHSWGRGRGARQGVPTYSKGRGRGEPSRSSRSPCRR